MISERTTINSKLQIGETEEFDIKMTKETTIWNVVSLECML